MGKTPEAQLGFVLDTENNWTAPAPVGEPPELERKFRPPRTIFFSKIEKDIHEQEGIESQGVFNANLAIGTAIDYFLVPAEFIYRYRADYCFDPNDPRYNQEWDLANVFGHYFPTGYKSEKDKYLELLEYFRKDFTEKNPLRPGNSQMERRLIKQRLIPLWDEIGRKFKLDSLALQQVMHQDGNFLLPSGRFASQEEIKDIAQRIVVERFDSLVENDPNYSRYAKPDCLLTFIVDDQEYSVRVQPDYAEILRTKRRSVKERIKNDQIPRYKRVVAKRIVLDLKDSQIRDFTNLDTAYGKSMLLYNWLLSQIGQSIKLGPKDKRWITFPNNQTQQVFIIPPEARIPEASVQTGLEFLREDADKMFTPMPTLNPEDKELAKSILEEALRRSTQSRLAA